VNLQEIRAFAVDLDGVVWEGEKLLPGAREFLQWCARTGRPVAFLTNTVSLSRARIVEKFRRLGVTEAEEEQVFSAGRAAVMFIRGRQENARVFVIGQRGTHEEVEAAGLQSVDSNADFVLIGMDRDIHFDRLKLACREALKGAELVAANEDRWFPEEDGPVPGAGCFKAYVEWCAGREAHLCGKPNPEIFRQALLHLRQPAERVAMIGDIPEVDLAGARKAGMKCILIGGHAAAGADAYFTSLAQLLERS
jgi:4-nitrophenyl phosphatase